MKGQMKKAFLYRTIKTLGRQSDKNINNFLKFVEFFASKKRKSVIKNLRGSLSIEDLQKKLYRNIMINSNTNFSRKFIENFLIQGIMLNHEKRLKLLDKGYNVPATILISPSMRCNLKCVGCYADSYSKKDDMDMALFERIIKEGKDIGVVFYTILGGEPFIREDVFDVYKRNSDAFFQVFTNGTLIDENKAKEIVKMGNLLIMFSVEGGSAETDFRRGEGVYQKVRNAMDLFKKNKLPFGFSVTVTSKNFDYITSDNFIDFMIEQGAVLGWYFLYMPVGVNPDLSLMPTAQQRLKLKEVVHRARAQKPVFLVDFWGDAPLVGGCIAGSQYAHINNKGDVEPCIFTHFAEVNIKDMPLLEALNCSYFRKIRSKQPYSDNLYRPCMLIDETGVSRELYRNCKIYPTHQGAEDILFKINNELDSYSNSVKETLDPVWEQEKCQYNYKRVLLHQDHER
ncbi:MAG: radical SAM protein [Actinobacteria bacterium]|nr:radical SAM protein [Actinomycetota bacterium]